jgi:small conductance mechanosensitive channel
MEKGLAQAELLGNLIIGYLPKVVGAILTLIIGFWVIGRVVAWIRRRMEKAEIDISLAKFLSSLISITLKVMLLLSVAGMFGVATTSFIAIFSAAAFAIGMALQGNLGHLASGVMLMIFKPFKVGDLVELDGKLGVVEGINAFNTTIKTATNRMIYLPNGTVTSGAITNISGQGTLGVDLTIGIGYTDDIDKAREVIRQVVDSCPTVLREPATLIEVNELADSSVNFLVRPWCKSEDFLKTKFYITENIKKAFDKEGIGIPYPQMDVHLFKQN